VERQRRLVRQVGHRLQPASQEHQPQHVRQVALLHQRVRQALQHVRHHPVIIPSHQVHQIHIVAEAAPAAVVAAVVAVTAVAVEVAAVVDIVVVVAVVAAAVAAVAEEDRIRKRCSN